MGRKLISLVLALVLTLSLVPAAGAAGGAKVTCSNVSARAGDYANVSIRAEGLEDLASLDLELYYDPDVLELSWHQTGWMLRDAMVSVHTSEPGLVRLSAAMPTGISGSDSLLDLQFYISSDCEPGKLPLTLAVGDAYDTSLQPVTISAVSGSITVPDAPPTHDAFRLGLELSTDSLCSGESLTATLCNAWSYGFASCDLTLCYDASLFRVKNAQVSQELARNAVCSLNTDLPGLVRLSCASANQMWCWELLTVELEALEDAEGVTRLTASAADIYDNSRIPYQNGSAQADVTIRSTEAPVLPGIRLEAGTLVIGEESTATLVLDAGSNLAAADFRLEYDTELLECLEVTAAAGSGMVVINPNFSEGAIRFSYVNQAGTAEETNLVTIRWKATDTANRHFRIKTTLVDPVDPDFERVDLDCPDQTGCIHRRERLEPTCTASGGEVLRCVGCGARIPLDPIAPLGHDYGEPEFFWSEDYETCTARRICARDGSHIWEVDCTVTHDSVGSGCTDPGSVTHTAAADFDGESYTESVSIEQEVLGHDYDWAVTTEPGCETEGRRTGTCTRCGDTREEAIAPLGHDWQGTACTRCGETRENPFTDVPEGSFYYDPVIWAVENGITNGTSATTFGPGDQCMRAHVVTFLWRAAGQPEPTAANNPFVDVKETDFYYKAVLWAVENGITNGLDATHFGPFAYCNRAQVVTFLHRALNKPEPGSQSNPFVDVPEGSFYHKPVLWAVENGVTNGLDATHFGPNAICNRAQIVTFLYRAFT